MFSCLGLKFAGTLFLPCVLQLMQSSSKSVRTWALTDPHYASDYGLVRSARVHCSARRFTPSKTLMLLRYDWYAFGRRDDVRLLRQNIMAWCKWYFVHVSRLISNKSGATFRDTGLSREDLTP
ncbi:uncharacterized protein EI90DRAFT_3074447 [Cantharellus anzutake]|uniref:uncharacterized protein n=1 Tax=Cantharellus anzutake TaxID=1750568 RepID=UPI00190697CA|nr:uncharacterized protein EI90DRAFT_3074447 [Cantharellus anzutake]KAF8324918.1 hypothetical protein EI90DRAFT_3074447 [Cantharellus anzutake]